MLMAAHCASGPLLIVDQVAAVGSTARGPRRAGRHRRDRGRVVPRRHRRRPERRHRRRRPRAARARAPAGAVRHPAFREVLSFGGLARCAGRAHAARPHREPARGAERDRRHRARRGRGGPCPRRAGPARRAGTRLLPAEHLLPRPRAGARRPAPQGPSGQRGHGRHRRPRAAPVCAPGTVIAPVVVGRAIHVDVVTVIGWAAVRGRHGDDAAVHEPGRRPRAPAGRPVVRCLDVAVGVGLLAVALGLLSASVALTPFILALRTRSRWRACSCRRPPDRRPLPIAEHHEDQSCRSARTCGPRRRRHRGAFVVPLASSASADTPPATPVDTVSADALPTWQINGVVWSQVVVGNTVYVTGSFTKARPPGVAAGGAGAVAGPTSSPTTSPPVTASRRSATSSTPRAWSSGSSPDGSRVYVGGDFTTVDGVARNHIAAFNTATGALDNAFKPPSAPRSPASRSAPTHRLRGRQLHRRRRPGPDPARRLQRQPTAHCSRGPPPPTPSRCLDDGAAPDGSKVVVGGGFTSLNGVPASGLGAARRRDRRHPALPDEPGRHPTAATSAGSPTSRPTTTRSTAAGYAFGSARNFEGTFAADPQHRRR